MNKPLGRLLTLILSVLLLGGCYNNSHIRTQRILEPGDKIISGYASANLVGADTDYRSHDIRHGGISGLRAGFSYLGYRKGYEQGASIGYGGGSGDYNSLLFGYDVRKVILSDDNKPYRYGLHTELNNVMPRDGEKIQKGSVIQLRPYISSTTSNLNDWYGGIHGLMSFGDIQSQDIISNWSGSHYTETEIDYTYKVSSLGLGVTVGSELRFGDFLVQSQIDVSYVNQQHEVNPDDYSYLISQSDEHYELELMDNSGLFISVGMAVGQAPESQKIHRVTPHLPRMIQNNSTPPQPTLKFDPFTGEIIPEPAPMADLTFDPYTGELINEKPSVFDPFTGLPALSEEPYSTLTANEQSALVMLGLRIISINAKPTSLSLQDVKNNGIVVYGESRGVTTFETLSYEDIQSVRFEGGRRGFSKGLKSAMSGCGLCIVLPLGASILTGEAGLFAMGLVTAPVVGLGTLIMTSMEADQYELHFIQTPNQQANNHYKQQVFTQLVKLYIESGFPSYQLTQLTANH
ncbi:MAG: hypothetical protein K9M55_03280 [Candidatus Marinimicrobia bacterium]|nr:hypothetical protein [Candidatus Neomarinimicrobiota bacterium]